ncbi:Putative ribonuclease H protein [Apostasia shenzhenica]|uniref:Ribonuclease H protein n=1 Tax=Apostasia shenzhenica TaxID=1088818 RepID=A0A2I0BCF7_9ASPA|nr:Putative ribonuclease H protein [Apostasia shenzhenica]
MDSKVMHFVVWEEACKPKSKGGLGIHKLRLWRQLLAIKLVARFMSSDNCLWWESLHAKYGRRRSMFEERRGDSWVWKLICIGGRAIDEHMMWLVEEGMTISFMDDLWLSTTLYRWPTFINMHTEQFPATVANISRELDWDRTKIEQLFRPELQVF